ncbi:sterol desaturase family protein [Marinobacter mobilis]|uniref:Fatty acid hydroxylase superfamily protein n=1 Tax=Marinobacter mobilis TaxID=488533 RepID=A0A1H3D2M1_9GAMM|nr:sterol desaturase family protein [Marinobacter mobilis]SDX60560.1 Fatty acid hydroxylase superfamily protein [Marinobacter mobilis]
MYAENTNASFRANYRAGISPRYNGYLHMAFVACVGVMFVVYQLALAGEFHWGHWLGLIVTLVLWNFAEYFIHIKLGHRKKRWAAMFYKRHTGDHHSFFTETALVPRNHRDWRVTLFPAWLVLVTATIATLVGSVIGWVLAPEWGHLFAGGLMIGYLAYEFFHFCDHLPQDHVLVRLPWIGHMRHLHKLHHRRDLMRTHNFNLTFPLADWVMGTYCWIPPEDCTRELDECP